MDLRKNGRRLITPVYKMTSKTKWPGLDHTEPYIKWHMAFKIIHTRPVYKIATNKAASTKWPSQNHANIHQGR